MGGAGLGRRLGRPASFAYRRERIFELELATSAQNPKVNYTECILALSVRMYVCTRYMICL